MNTAEITVWFKAYRLKRTDDSFTTGLSVLLHRNPENIWHAVGTVADCWALAAPPT